MMSTTHRVGRYLDWKKIREGKEPSTLGGRQAQVALQLPTRGTVPSRISAIIEKNDGGGNSTYLHYLETDHTSSA